MKNSKLKLFSVLSVAFLLAACGGNKQTTGGDDNTGDDDDNTEIDLTVGVYNNLLGSKYDLLMKFYDEDDVYFQNENEGFRAKYKLVEGSITYAYTKDDGSIADTAAVPDKAGWIEGTHYIQFFEEDGVTPFNYVFHTLESGDTHNPEVVLAGEGYAVGTPTDRLAYDVENDQIISFKGANGSRSLAHNVERTFTIENEKEILQAKYMVKTLPADAPDGAKESDYFLTLSQKGYATTIPALTAKGISIGLFEKSGNNYNLTDTITGATGVIEVGENSVVAKVDDVSVELVTWAEVANYAARLTGMGGTLTLNEDGTFDLPGNMTLTGTYGLNKDGNIEMTFDENALSAELKSATIEGDNLTIVIHVNVPSRGEMDLTFTGKIVGTLAPLTARSLLKVGSTVYGNPVELNLLSDETLSISGLGKTLATGFYHANLSGTPSITFRNVSNGEFTFQVGQTCKISWTAVLQPGTDPTTIEFSFAGSELSNLSAAKLEAKVAIDGEAWNTRAVQFVFYVDNTLALTVADSVIATATWELTVNNYTPAFTFANSTNGEFSATFGEGSTFVFSWTGVVNPQMPNASTLTATIPSSDLANFQ